MNELRATHWICKIILIARGLKWNLIKRVHDILSFRRKLVEVCVRRKIHSYAFIGLIVEAGWGNEKEIMLRL
jgi:hypothetical protein